MSGFQTTVPLYSSPASAGQIASGNPQAWYVAGPGALVSGANGLTVGGFAWATPITAGDTPERADSNALLVAAGLARVPDGFVLNEQQGNIQFVLQESSLNMLPWQNCALLTRGDVWVKGPGGIPAVRKQKVFANMLDGSVAYGAAGATVVSSAITASFATNVMTVTAAVATIKIGTAVIGAGVPANTYVAAFGTGTGGNGTYTLTTTPGTIASQSNTITEYIETRFLVQSAALAGEFAKIGFGD